jgi:hypothetical protein
MSTISLAKGSYPYNAWNGIILIAEWKLLLYHHYVVDIQWFHFLG